MLWNRLGLVTVGMLCVAGVLEAVAVWLQARPRVTEGDWKRAGAYVRGRFEKGDLLVFAPEWYAPVGRLHLGDLLDVDQVSRPDDDRCGRIWVVARRGASYETRARLVSRRRFGGLVVSEYRQRPARVVYDFYERVSEAQVTLVDRRGHVVEECGWQEARRRHQCRRGWNNVRQKLAEIGYRLRRCLYAHPTEREVLRIDFSSAVLGDRIVIHTGLDDYDSRYRARRAVRQARRKGREPKALYPVRLRVLVDGAEVGHADQPIDEVWHRWEIPTKPRSVAHVTFLVSTRYAYGKRFCFYAEARK